MHPYYTLALTCLIVAGMLVADTPAEATNCRPVDMFNRTTKRIQKCVGGGSRCTKSSLSTQFKSLARYIEQAAKRCPKVDIKTLKARVTALHKALAEGKKKAKRAPTTVRPQKSIAGRKAGAKSPSPTPTRQPRGRAPQPSEKAHANCPKARACEAAVNGGGGLLASARRGYKLMKLGNWPYTASKTEVAQRAKAYREAVAWWDKACIPTLQDKKLMSACGHGRTACGTLSTFCKERNKAIRNFDNRRAYILSSAMKYLKQVEDGLSKKMTDPIHIRRLKGPMASASRECQHFLALGPALSKGAPAAAAPKPKRPMTARERKRAKRKLKMAPKDVKSGEAVNIVRPHFSLNGLVISVKKCCARRRGCDLQGPVVQRPERSHS